MKANRRQFYAVFKEPWLAMSGLRGVQTTAAASDKVVIAVIWTRRSGDLPNRTVCFAPSVPPCGLRRDALRPRPTTGFYYDTNHNQNKRQKP